MKKILNVVSPIILLILLLAVPPRNAFTQGQVVCESDVIVQADDWLSKIADKFFGDVLAYPAIQAATNAKAAEDGSYATITDPNLIEPGWKLCIPTQEWASEVLAEVELFFASSLEGLSEDEQAILSEHLNSPGPSLEGFEPVGKLPVLEELTTLEDIAQEAEEVISLAAESEYTIAEYARDIESELGRFPTFNVFEQGQIIPITVDGVEQTSGVSQCDRPALLGQGQPDGDQCNPYALLGTLEANKENVHWVFIARRYNSTTRDDPKFTDVAVIGHNIQTGATAFFQMLDYGDQKDARRVPSPWEPASETPPGQLTAEQFWLTPEGIANIECYKCHSADPIIFSPYVSQVKDDSGKPILSSAADPNGPYNHLKVGPFASWPDPEYLEPDDNRCTSCHRIGTYDGARLVAQAVGQQPNRYLTAAYSTYPHSHWMPADKSKLVPYSDSGMPEESWINTYSSTVQVLLSCIRNSSQEQCNTGMCQQS